MDRRKFLRIMGMAGAAAAIPWRFDPRRGFQGDSAWAFYQSLALQKFVQPLRGENVASLISSATGIPVAAPDATLAPVTGVTHYTINIAQYTDTLHPSLGATTLWGYRPTVTLGANPTHHLGGLIVAQKGVPIQITFQNNLPTVANSWGQIHPLPVDVSANFPDASFQNRVAVHLHGGLVPWVSDGGPFDYFSPNGIYGPSFLNNSVFNPGAAVGQAEYFYGMNQSARLLWYHDHYHDLTRLNAYAGIASACLLRDTFEAGLIGGTSNYIENGGPEIPIIIQDKIFVDAATIAGLDPTWPGPRTTGSLWYAHVYERNRWKLSGSAAKTVPNPSVIPEFFGDTMLANGTVFPEAAVDAKRYRLRVLNACNARFLNLQLYVDDGSADGITLNPATLVPTNAKGPDFLVLGTEGGFLPSAVTVASNLPFNPVTLGGSLITGPAERWDLIVDFTNFAGKKIILYNDAPAPFPIGDPRNDYFPGAPKNPTITTAGFGPNTRQIMRFNVGATATDTLPVIAAGTNLTAGNDPLFVTPGSAVVNGVFTPPAGASLTRQLTLNETFDAFGRLIQLLGTNVPLVKGTFGRAYLDPTTETPLAGATEIWQIANLTGDTHPIHFHLVNVQILARQPFKVSNYTGGLPTFLGPARPPDPDEQGWKETVRMNPGEITWVMMTFTLPANPPNVATIPVSPRTGGFEYVWHCHILEHEEHDMMRPLVVT